MRTWDLALDLSDRSSTGAPIYRQIAEVIAADISRGRLLPGERLPSTRTLAAALGVNRNTVVAAFEELRIRGWITGRAASGTHVAEVLPLGGAPGDERSPAVGFDLPPPGLSDRSIRRTPTLLLLLGGVPDLRSVPHRELGRAYAQALKGARGRRLVDYADPQGSERLRAALGDLLARARGIRASPESICVVRGSQQGLYLVARSLVRPGDVVAVEATGYPPAWEVMRLAGAELAPIPVDPEGMDIGALEALCERRRVRAVVVTPHHQYPTTVTLSASRRQRLLRLAERHRMAVVEDDYDYDFHYEGLPVLPLAASDRAGVVVYVATLSKTLAPGLRLGYVVACPEVVRRVTDYRTWVDHQGDHALEQAAAILLEEGEIQRHVRRMRRAYRQRRDTLCELLRRELPELRFDLPVGGMAIWGRAPGIDTDRWVERALQAGVAFQSGRRFAFDGEPNEHVRIGFAACNEAELAEAVRRLAASLRHPG